MKSNTEIMIFSNAGCLFEFAANDFSQRANTAIADKGKFSVVLSGGTTPKLFFDILVENHSESIPWDQIQYFFGDERYVPSDDEKSNYHMAYEHLFSKVPVNRKNIFSIPTDVSDPKEAAMDYERTLRHAFHLNDTNLPPFDLVYLGLGANAHTASLMPLSEVVKLYANDSLPNEENPLTASLFDPISNTVRITLTPPAINNAKNIIFLVTGANKATAVSEVLERKADPLHFPAQLIHCIAGKTLWYLDKAAAKKLSINTVKQGEV